MHKSRRGFSDFQLSGGRGDSETQWIVRDIPAAPNSPACHPIAQSTLSDDTEYQDLSRRGSLELSNGEPGRPGSIRSATSVSSSFRGEDSSETPTATDSDSSKRTDMPSFKKNNPLFPFNKLAILEEQEQLLDLTGCPFDAFESDPRSYTAMVDSGRKASDLDNSNISRRSSLQSLNSFGTNGSVSGVSRSSVSNGQLPSLPEGRKLRQTASTLGDSTIEEEPAKEDAIGRPPSPEADSHIEAGLDDIDMAFDSKHGKMVSRPNLYLADAIEGKMCRKMDKKFRILDPLAHFRGNKKRKKYGQCKWDVFPGVKPDPRYLASPFHKGHLADPRNLSFIATPFKSGHFADPRQLKNIVSLGKRSKSRAMDSWASSENSTQENLSMTKSSDEDTADDATSPRGPLSMRLSPATTQDDMEQQLTRTFGHEELVAWEAQELAEKEANTHGALPSRPSSSNGSWQPSEPIRHFHSAPIKNVVEKIKTAIPDSMKYKRSATAPQLHHSSFSHKETGKLRVEKFRGITFVNEYALVRTIGKGSYGTVKLALNTTNHELYALKLLPKSRKARNNRQGSLHVDAEVRHEIEVMKNLAHPNIVRLHEVIDDPLNSKMLLVLEYTEGGAINSGHKLNPTKRFTELLSRKYFRDVITGLDYLHANQLAHGDIKLDNILIDAAGKAKIADFGSSQLTRKGEVVKRTSGTPAFLAPEVSRGEQYHARIADVWSLGVCLYMFVFGTVPFKSDSILGLYEAIQTQEVEFPDNVFISDSLKHLILRLLDKDPETRISLVGAMNHPWVTHNGAYALESLQGLENDEDEDSRAMLLECWPDNPAGISVFSVFQTLAPLFEKKEFRDGEKMARQGDPARFVMFLEEGEAIIYHTKKADAGLDSDDEDEEEEGSGEIVDKRKRLKRAGSMLKTMYCATITASRLVSAVRDYASGSSTLISTRGPGSFIGEASFYQKGLDATWQTCVVAKGNVKVRLLAFKALKTVVKKRPEIEADMRAILAQRQGELMKMEMLEKLAGLHDQLRKEVQLATEAGGASQSAIEAARDLLGCTQFDAKLKARDMGVKVGENGQMQAVSKDDDDSQIARYLGDPEDSIARTEDSSNEENHETAELEPRSSSASSVRSSINEKGDSAKNLSAFENCKSHCRIETINNHDGLSTIPSQEVLQ